MAIETQAPISRRGLLAALIGGTAAAVAGIASRAERALGAGSDGETFVIGGEYDDVRTPINLRREVDPERPMLRFTHAAPGNGTGTTEVGAAEVSLSLADSTFQGPSSTQLRPGRLLLTSVDRFSDDTHRTVVASSGISTRSIRAVSRNEVAVEGVGRIGGTFAGRRAQIRLEASDRGTHPESGVRGDLFVDRQGRLWFCKGGQNWKQLA